MAVKPLPPRDLVRQLLDYDPDTGIFVWRRRPPEKFPSQHGWNVWNARFSEKPAGTVAHDYISIIIDYRHFYAHRLAWLYVHGEPVPNELDHIDRDKSNNRINNLRAATRGQNNVNAGASKANKLGMRGVYPTPGGRYYAQVKKDGVAKTIGTFDTPEEAEAAYRAAAIALHGKFAEPTTLAILGMGLLALASARRGRV